MKRIYTYILLMVCGILVTSCQKDFDGVFNAEIQDYANGGGKVYVDGEGYACWNSGDMVNINGESYPIEISGDKATITTKFDSKPNAFRAVFPASYDKENNIIALPSEQTYVEDNKGMQKVNAPMVAYTTGSEMHFFNVCSLLKLTIVSADAEIKMNKITIENKISGTSGYLSGDFTYTQGCNATPSANLVEKGGKKIMLNIPNGCVFKGSKSFYIVVPKIDNDNAKLAITMEYDKNSEPNTCTLTMSKGKTIPMNMILNLKYDLHGTTIGWEGDGTEKNPYKIQSLKDFNLFVKKCKENKGFAGVFFEQHGSIVLDNNFAGIEEFAGTYNGNNQLITIGNENNKGKSGLFKKLSGKADIKNLNVKVTLDGGDGNVGGIVNDIQSSATNVKISNCVVTGSIVGKNAGGVVGNVLKFVTIKNCVNKADVSGYGNVTSPWVGGMIGNCSGGTTIINSINHGVVRTHTTGSCGGLIGCVKSSVSVKNSYSSVQALGSAQSNLGGIVGNVNSGSCSIDNVYVGGEKSTNGKWVIGSGSATCSHVYSPSATDNGCTATQYDGSWKVGDVFLYSVLSGNCEGNSDWVDWVATSSTNNQPKLNFE